MLLAMHVHQRFLIDFGAVYTIFLFHLEADANAGFTLWPMENDRGNKVNNIKRTSSGSWISKLFCPYLKHTTNF